MHIMTTDSEKMTVLRRPTLTPFRRNAVGPWTATGEHIARPSILSLCPPAIFVQWPEYRRPRLHGGKEKAARESGDIDRLPDRLSS
jgi:hypothetical protein